MNPKAPLHLFFSKRESLISRIIASLQDGISHCGFIYYLPRIDSPYILESKGHGGFNYSDDDEFKANVKIVEEYQILWTTAERQAFIDFTNKLLREQYGFLGVVGMIIVLLFKHCGGKTHNPFIQGYFCSQATYLVIRDVFGFLIDGNPDERSVGPDDLRDYMRQLAQQRPEKVIRIK